MSDAKSDQWRLDRFVAAQDRGGTYQRAVAELRAGAKVSHWMWFVFPQVAGLGMSAMSREYAISGAAEARAYLAHPVLGPRLRECARIVADTEGRTAEQVFGYVDAVKLRSSMTLFAAAEDGATEDAAGGVVPPESGATAFRDVLAKYFGGVPDEETLARLSRLEPSCRAAPAAFPFDHTFELRHNGRQAGLTGTCRGAIDVHAADRQGQAHSEGGRQAGPALRAAGRGRGHAGRRVEGVGADRRE